MYSLLIFFFILAISISFLCSLWEAVLLSVTPSFAQGRLQEGSEIGHLLQGFKENIDRPLAAILTLNTIAHTVGAIGVGNQAAKIWAEGNPLLTGLVVPATMTLAILVLSELIPKTLGANFWKELVPFTVKSLRLIIALLAPLVALSQLVTGAFKKDKSKTVFTRSDFLAMARLGVSEGVFKARESHMIGNLLRFDAIQAKDIMTPRTVVLSASEAQTLEQFYARAGSKLRFTRIPLHEEQSREHITGYIRKDDLLGKLVEGEGDNSIGSIKRDIMVVEEGFALPALFDRFMNKREHIAVVIDEFGGMAGIVTVEDVIETLLGLEIVDEADCVADMQALARRSWEVRARRLGIIPEQAEPESDAEDPSVIESPEGASLSPSQDSSEANQESSDR